MRYALKALKNERSWLVRETKKGLELIRMLGGRPIVVNLEKQEEKKKYKLVFPSYVFESKISHYGPATEEIRFCRNKSLLISLIKALKRSAAWALIDNHNFMVINDMNPRSNKQKLRKELRAVYGYTPSQKKFV